MKWTHINILKLKEERTYLYNDLKKEFIELWYKKFKEKYHHKYLCDRVNIQRAFASPKLNDSLRIWRKGLDGYIQEINKAYQEGRLSEEFIEYYNRNATIVTNFLIKL